MKLRNGISLCFPQLRLERSDRNEGDVEESDAARTTRNNCAILRMVYIIIEKFGGRIAESMRSHENRALCNLYQSHRAPARDTHTEKSSLCGVQCLRYINALRRH